MTPAAPEVVRINDLSKRFVVRRDNSIKERIVTLGRAGRRHREEFWALKNITLSIEAGTTIGLIGHNGSGKSTLLKAIGGVIAPTSGSIEQRGRIAALLELGAGFHPDLTGRENVYLNASILGLSRDETSEKFDEILAFAGIGDFIDSQVKFYSSGMYVRLAFAVAIHTDPDLLLVDEVLAVGDESFQRKCLDKIREFQRQGRTIVLVSHGLGQIQEFCDRVVLLNRGEVEFDGDPERAVARFREVLEQRDRSDAVAQGSPGIPPFELVDAALLVDGEKRSAPEAEALTPGADLSVQLTFRNTRETEPWECAIQVDDDAGRRVVNVDSSMHAGGYLPPLDGTSTCTLTLRDANFGPGRYYVNVSVMSPDRTHVYDAPHRLTFQYERSRKSKGYLALDSDFTESRQP